MQHKTSQAGLTSSSDLHRARRNHLHSNTATNGNANIAPSGDPHHEDWDRIASICSVSSLAEASTLSVRSFKRAASDAESEDDCDSTSRPDSLAPVLVVSPARRRSCFRSSEEAKAANKRTRRSSTPVTTSTAWSSLPACSSSEKLRFLAHLEPCAKIKWTST